MSRNRAFGRILRHESLETRNLLAASGMGAGEPLADFQLVDTNPTSASYNQMVSPSDFSGQTSVWYYIHST
jgi:hypothetical protein